MNFWLGFKNHDHDQAFVSEFSIRIKRKLIIGLIINAWYAISVTATILIERRATTASFSGVWAVTKVAIALLWIIGVFSIRLKLEKFRKYHALIFFLFDIVQCCVALTFFGVSPGRLGDVGTLRVLTNGWTSGLQYAASLLLIDSWQIRVLHIIVQITIHSVCNGIADNSNVSVIIFLVDTFFMYALFFYFSEKFKRMEFLEKRKIYEDSEAVKTILDDITEGIVIINRQKKIVYLNQPVQKMFRLEQHKTADDLFSRIKIKSMMSSETLKKQFQQISKSSEQVMNSDI